MCVSSASRGKRGAAEKEKRTYWFRPGDFPRAGGSLSPRAALAAAVAIRVGNGVVPYGLPPPDVSSNSYFPASIYRLSRILLFAPSLSVSAPSVSRDEITTFFRCQSTSQSIRAPHKVRGTFHPPKRRQRLCGDKTDHWMIAAFPPTLVQSGKGHSPDIYALK